MSDHSVRIRVLDILDEIETIEKILIGKDFVAYQSSFITKRATERCLEIISETSRHIPEDIRMRFPDVPWNKIRGIGNVLRHEYSRVQDEVLWRVTEDALPELKRIMNEILAILPPDTEA